MPQPDFAMLAILLADDTPHFHEAVEDSFDSVSIDRMHDDKSSSGAPEEVNVASPSLTETSPIDKMELDEPLVSIIDDMFEPVRTLKVFAPPKRFHRTFWRSASRRMLALSKNQLM